MSVVASWIVVDDRGHARKEGLAQPFIQLCDNDDQQAANLNVNM